MMKMADPLNDSKPVTPPSTDNAVIDAQAQRIPAPGISSTPSDAASVPVLGQPASNPAIPAGSEINKDPNAVPGSVQPHHGVLASIFQDLAGGQKTTWRQTENGPVAVKENLRPAEMARGILAAALTGLASGYATRGGAGGNKAQAFAAGFEGNEKRVDQNKQKAKQDAQQEFQNKNVTDELTLRKMINARDQQRSIDEHQEASIRIDQMKRNLEQGQIRDAHEQIEWMQNQQEKYNILTAAGAKPLTGFDGKPIPEFDNNDDLVKWLHTGNNSEIAIQKGRYNTVIATDPVTGKIQILQKPKGWDDPQWVGVKTDNNGNPVRDKSGNFVPDGTFRDMNGKVTSPAGPMTPHQLYDSQTRLLDLQSKVLSRQEQLERIKNMRHENAKNAALDLANKHLEQTNGDLDALDPTTHKSILTMADRNILQQQVKMGTEEAAFINSTRKELDRMDPKDPEYAETLDSLHEAERNYAAFQYRQLLLSRVPNPADVISKRLRTDNTDAQGAYHEDEAIKQIPQDLNSGVKQAIRQKLAAKAVPSGLDKAVEAVSHLSKDQQESQISNSSLSADQKKSLFDYFGITPKSAPGAAQITSPDKLSTIDPDTTLMSDGALVPNEAIETYRTKHPNTTVVGRGTKQKEQEPQFGSR
jgi:hypothetical protein